jgi:hypothetical protein
VKKYIEIQGKIKPVPTEEGITFSTKLSNEQLNLEVEQLILRMRYAKSGEVIICMKADFEAANNVARPVNDVIPFEVGKEWEHRVDSLLSEIKEQLYGPAETQQEIFHGVDVADGIKTVVTMRRDAAGVVTVLGEEQIATDNGEVSPAASVCRYLQPSMFAGQMPTCLKREKPIYPEDCEGCKLMKAPVYYKAIPEILADAAAEPVEIYCSSCRFYGKPESEAPRVKCEFTPADDDACGKYKAA